jgi:glycosyltransferase involved in cell wall biosynthesis
VLVEAYQQLNTDVKLVMAGAASYCDEYSERIRKCECERIKILDWVSGAVLDELLTNAMIFVMPSDLEGLSLAVLDAMGAGLCVVVSDVAENREAVADCGFTFCCGDSADLADRLSFLIANPAVREAAGRSARSRVRQHYQWPMIAKEIEKVYLDMMGWEAAEMEKKKPQGEVSAPAAAREFKVG